MRRLFMILCPLLLVTALGSSASLAQSKLDTSILSYDGKDFVRTETTLMNEGQSAVGTKLAPDSPAYIALVEKHSYTGPATVFGRDYQANYAPLIPVSTKITPRRVRSCCKRTTGWQKPSPWFNACDH
jgi:cache 3/cache 2 fusion protein